jgi:glutamate synthase domain-containing protein 2
MSEAYIDIFERFVKLQEIMRADNKQYKKDAKKTARIASLLAMASVYSNYSMDRQYAVFKAMKITMSEKLDTYRALSESVDDIAATLIVASEMNKQPKS